MKESQRYNIRRDQVLRQNREYRTKGGAAILVRNSIPAQNFRISINNQAEDHDLTITLENQQIRILNIYYPVDRDLSHMELVLGDFNSQSKAWG